MSKIRQTISSRLKESQNTNAALTTFNEIDMGAFMDARKEVQEAFTKKHGVKLGFTSAFLKASCHALKEQPVVNAVIDGGDMVYRDFIDISTAVSTPRGLMTPVLRNAQDMNFADLEHALADMAVKARDGKITLEDLAGGSDASSSDVTTTSCNLFRCHKHSVTRSGRGQRWRRAVDSARVDLGGWLGERLSV